MNNKDKIAEITFALSLKYGFDNVSLKQIQDEANVTTGAIYYHFKDKNDILVYIIKKYLLNETENFKLIITQYNVSSIDKLRFIFYYHTGLNIEDDTDTIKLPNKEKIDYKEYYLFLTGVFHQHPELRSTFYELNRGIFDLYNDLTKEAIKRKEIRDDLPSEEIALYIFTVFMGFIELSTVFSDYSLKNMIETNLKAIWDYIKPR